MDDQLLSLNDYVATLNRRKWELIIPAVLVLTAAIAVAMALPTMYRSTATILIEQQEIPIDLVRSTVTTYADQRVQVIRQRVMTTENLTQIIERYSLYEAARSDSGISTAVEQMRKDIQIEMISADVVDPRSGRPAVATIAFTISYDSDSPIQAQRVTNDIVSLFLNENLRERQRTAKDATRFLEQESAKLAETVNSLEARLAQFKERYGNSVPEMMQVNLQLMERTDDNLRQVDQEIRSLEINHVYLQSELAKLNPYTLMYTGSGDRILSPADRLRSLETEYLTTKSRYAESHPDVLAIQREIETLRREVGLRSSEDIKKLLTEQRSQLATLQSKYSREHPDVKTLERQVSATEKLLNSGAEQHVKATTPVKDADNPAYIQIAAQLAANQSRLDSLRQTREDIIMRTRDLEDRISEAPKVEREYKLITRDYESAMDKYNQVRSKLMEATLAESLESESKGERFTLIEPPLLPERPFSPNRLAIVVLGVVISVGTGTAYLSARELLDGGIYALSAITSVAGSPPLAIIPVIRTDADYRRRKHIRLSVTLLLATTIAVTALILHNLIMPLDVVWFKLLARVGP